MKTKQGENNLFRTFKSEGKTYHTFNNKVTQLGWASYPQ